MKPAWAKGEFGLTYEDMVTSWGYDVLSFTTLGSYEGDHFVLLSDGDRRGYVVIGYGSCSGCDALEAAAPWSDDGDWSEVEQLRDRLHDEVRWCDSATALADRLESLDPANEWWLFDDDVKAERDRVVAVLREAGR